MTRKRTTTCEEISRDKALTLLEEFTVELEKTWKRNNLEWAFDLLTLIRLFVLSATKKIPDHDQMEILRDELANFVKRRKFLSGLDYVLQYADAVCKAAGK